ncbi:MAG: diphthine--ammonia ligase [Thermoplasmata archaeon]|nr:diphthine--ammonia ligase [Thermoplasmata archaeon]
MTGTALLSGGKDSVYSAYLADCQGITVDELLTLRPSNPDSWMFHTPNLDVVPVQAAAWGKAHRFVEIPGEGEDAETEALTRALSGASGWVIAGAIASAYQWSRLHRVCEGLGRPVYAPLWGKDGRRVVEEEIGAGLDIRLAHLAAEPLTPELLGQSLDRTMLDELERRSRERRAFHLAGEGGEYETLVVGAPFWHGRIGWRTSENRVESGVSDLAVRGAHLVVDPPGGRAP